MPSGLRLVMGCPFGELLPGFRGVLSIGAFFAGLHGVVRIGVVYIEKGNTWGVIYIWRVAL